MSLSAVFLGMNAFVMVVLIFIVCGDKSANIVDVIKKYCQKGASMTFNNDSGDPSELINKEKGSEDYLVT